MEMNNEIVKFKINKKVVEIECRREEFLKDIIFRFCNKVNMKPNEMYYFYKGKKLIINENQKLDEIKDSKKNITTTILALNLKEAIKKENKDQINCIICPDCKYPSLINVNNNKVSISGCEGGHQYQNIAIHDFNLYHHSEESILKCNNCDNNKLNEKNIYKNKYYICSCGLIFCSSCKKKDKKKGHKIINFNKKYFYCNTHTKKFDAFCNECNKNLCSSCISEEIDFHNNIVFFSDILPNEDDMNKNKLNLYEFKRKLEVLNDEIKEIMNKLATITDDLNKFLNIYLKLINNFELGYLNLQSINNIKNINKTFINESGLMDDINKVINEKEIRKKVNYLLDLHFNLNKPKEENILRIKEENDEFAEIDNIHINYNEKKVINSDKKNNRLIIEKESDVSKNDNGKLKTNFTPEDKGVGETTNEGGNVEMINIQFVSYEGNRINMVSPDDVQLKALFSAYAEKAGKNKNYFEKSIYFIYNGHRIENDDEMTLRQKGMRSGTVIHVSE